jgi:hypothetical protein
VRRATPSFARIDETWFFAVFSATPSSRPICRFVSPVGDELEHPALGRP